jgi:hypothetical protein
MDFLNSLAFDVFKDQVSNLIWLLIGVAAAYLLKYVSIIRPSKRLWQLKQPEKLIFCLSTSIIDTGEHRRPSTGVGQVRALTYAITSLNKCYKNVNFKNVMLSEEQIKTNIENDLLLFGGPKTNQITKLFFEKFDYLNIIHQADDSSIYWQKTNRVYRGEIINGVVLRDHALIIKIDNLFAYKSGTKLILFSGSHTYGTIAAAQYFCEILQKDKKIKPNTNFAALLSCEVVDGFPSHIKLEDLILL